jgi:hypothetical protein
MSSPSRTGRRVIHCHQPRACSRRRQGPAASPNGSQVPHDACVSCPSDRLPALSFAHGPVPMAQCQCQCCAAATLACERWTSRGTLPHPHPISLCPAASYLIAFAGSSHHNRNHSHSTPTPTPTPHHTTPHPHPLPHPSVSFLFAPAAAAVRFSLPTSTNHLSPMLPAVPLNRRDGVRLLSSVVPWSSAPHTALYAQLTNPRPQSIPQSLNSSIPQSLHPSIPTEGPVCATPLHPPSARAPPPAHRPALADDPGVCNTARPCSWPCSLPAWLPLTLS